MESFFRSLFVPRLETGPQHSTHSLSAQEGNKKENITSIGSKIAKHTKVEDTNLKRTREDLQNRIDILRKQVEGLSLMLSCGMMEKYGGLLLTHRVLKMT
ncbi:hypothetical protein I3760_13G132700 [Carya illinoinensis]|nr:hypothetical protein I3760_13G132700 [Carya illinoinensis]KAG2674397.1 hypothetical protein I3760_13G132700 [Carya illinoinensis]